MMPGPIRSQAGESALARRLALANIVVWRLAATAMIVTGIMHWMGLIGLEPGQRFDLLDFSGRVAAPVLAVLYPVAGVGLWMLARWGVVVWIMVAAVEATLRFGLSDDIAPSAVCLALHALGLAAVGAFAATRSAGAWLSGSKRAIESVKQAGKTLLVRRG